MDAERWLLTGILLGIVFVALVAVGRFWPSSVQSAVRTGDPVETLFQAMVTTIVTGVTLVVSINQLVLSQELDPVGVQRTQMEETLDFRSAVESHVDDAVSPADPASFLQSLLSAMRDRAEDIERNATGTEVASFASDVAASADRVSERLEGSEFGTFHVVRAVLDFDYSRRIYEARRVRATHGDPLSAEAEEAFEELLETLQLFGPAREHFKTLYFQWELINLSRDILYAAIPAFTTAVAMILFFEGPATVPGATVGIDNLLWLLVLTTLVTIGPFMVLVSHILRIVTVAKRTLAIGPFVLRDTGDDTATGSE